MSQDVLIVFTRFPEPGRTKTRLIPALGPEGAAELQRAMSEHTIQRVTNQPDRGYSITIRYDGGDEARMRDWLGTQSRFRPQHEGDLGQRLRHAFGAEFEAGAHACAAIGIDCPDVSGSHVARAFTLLDEHDVVLGPATDGGYYLIAISAPAAVAGMRAAFEGIDWGTEAVRAQTHDRLAAAGLRMAELEPLDDVDRPEDIAVWERARGE